MEVTPSHSCYAFIPDTAFISKESLPNRPVQQVYGPPDLAVEVNAPNDSKRQLRQKAEDYLRFGMKMVWLVFRGDLRVEVSVPDQDVVEVGIDGTLPVRDTFPA